MALFELLINTPATGNLIREGKLHQLAHVIQTGQQQDDDIRPERAMASGAGTAVAKMAA